MNINKRHKNVIYISAGLGNMLEKYCIYGNNLICLVWRRGRPGEVVFDERLVLEKSKIDEIMKIRGYYGDEQDPLFREYLNSIFRTHRQKDV